MGREFDNECIVCERPLGALAGITSVNHEGEMVKLCCPLCFDTFMDKKNFYFKRRKALKAGEKIKGFRNQY